jgi:hypothetical protein
MDKKILLFSVDVWNRDSSDVVCGKFINALTSKFNFNCQQSPIDKAGLYHPIFGDRISFYLTEKEISREPETSIKEKAMKALTWLLNLIKPAKKGKKKKTSETRARKPKKKKILYTGIQNGDPQIAPISRTPQDDGRVIVTDDAITDLPFGRT